MELVTSAQCHHLGRVSLPAVGRRLALSEVRAELPLVSVSQHCGECWALRLSPRDPWWWDFAVTSSHLLFVSGLSSLQPDVPCLGPSYLCCCPAMGSGSAQSLNPALATSCGLLVALIWKSGLNFLPVQGSEDRALVRLFAHLTLLCTDAETKAGPGTALDPVIWP